MSAQVIRLGTRASLLARRQSAHVAQQIENLHWGLRVQTILIQTTGDQITDRPLHEIGGKGLFVKEVEQALISGQIELAVHSAKDLPVTMPVIDETGLMIAAVPIRHDPRDVLISEKARAISELPANARVATGSLRRRCQLLSMRPDLQILPLRGNVDTRIRKLRAGEADAIVLAMAGVQRAELFDPKIMWPIPLEELLPAPGQGCLALQCRKDDKITQDLLAPLNDSASATCLEVERKVVNGLQGDCHSPIAALARIEGHVLMLRVAVGKRGGDPPLLFAAAAGPRDDYLSLVEEVLADLRKKGCDQHLHGR